MWQTLRAELHPHGLEIVTVALDTGGAAAARRWIDAAHPEHPALIDQAHQLDALLGIVNVPSGVWIDEQGMIVRPPEPAFPQRPAFQNVDPDNPVLIERYRDNPRGLEVVREVLKLRIEPEAYVAALRDWVANGAASRYALAPDEVVRRSRPRPAEVAEAAAVGWFRRAHRLQPGNWTYKRQAWSFADPRQGPTELYEGDWLSDVRAIGAENYYPPLDL